MSTARNLACTAALSAALLGTVPAGAAVLFSDNFDGDSTASTLNFAALTNWTVSDGSIDYIRSGGFGINCVGNAGGCLDMDGSSNNAGRITSKATYTLVGGVTYTLSGLVSGNQRGGANDGIFFGLIDTATNTVAFSDTVTGIGPTAAFSLQSTLVSGATGSFRLFFEGLGSDNVGVILDNVVFSDSRTSTVPVPGSLALALAALAALTAARRRA